MLVNSIAFKRSSVKSEVSDCPRRSLRLKFELCRWRVLHQCKTIESLVTTKKRGQTLLLILRWICRLSLYPLTILNSGRVSRLSLIKYVFFEVFQPWMCLSEFSLGARDSFAQSSSKCHGDVLNVQGTWKFMNLVQDFYIWPESYIVPALPFWW